VAGRGRYPRGDGIRHRRDDHGGRHRRAARRAADPDAHRLLVLAVGSGSPFFSHVNDGGFWLVKEYFGLTVGETIRSWSVMETIISVVGLIGVLLLSLVV
jgi:H+/gluconate symporter-like permease